MIAVNIAPWNYGVFVVGMLLILSLDLGLFNRKAHKVGFKEALGWSTLWFTLAMVFAFAAIPEVYDNESSERFLELDANRNGKLEQEECLIKHDDASFENPDPLRFNETIFNQFNTDGNGVLNKGEYSLVLQHISKLAFITGYILELALSMDNVFVILLIFSYFKVKPIYQHRVLFWGIMGALIMRGLMIGVGAVAVAEFHWILYVFGAFLLFTGIKMLFYDDEDGVEPDKNPLVKLARKLFPVHDQFEGERFIVIIDGKRMLTPMAIVLVTIEYTDVIFAVDSIPAIFAVTTDPYIVFTSNMFAILGLRSLYFVLAGMIEVFHYLKYGLALVLAFIGLKMLAEPWLRDFDIPAWGALVVVVGILLFSILASLLHKKNDSEDSGDAK
ncbi:TerC family protein [Verrucomicrobia bacterium]|nr:TerC family protein [Verrucomicrobiota bacterium]